MYSFRVRYTLVKSKSLFKMYKMPSTINRLVVLWYRLTQIQLRLLLWINLTISFCYHYLIVIILVKLVLALIERLVQPVGLTSMIRNFWWSIHQITRQHAKHFVIWDTRRMVTRIRYVNSVIKVAHLVKTREAMLELETNLSV